MDYDAWLLDEPDDGEQCAECEAYRDVYGGCECDRPDAYDRAAEEAFMGW